MDLPAFNEDIHQPTRLRILTLLHRNRSAAFTWVRDTLGLSDGNLGRHVHRLEQLGYIRRERTLTTRGFQLRFRITVEGQAAFEHYLDSLRAYLEQSARRDSSP